MKRIKKYFREINNFIINVLISITLIWGMYLAIILTIKIPVLGIPILAIGILMAILMRKKEYKMNNS